jgi:hypothetical protein
MFQTNSRPFRSLLSLIDEMLSAPIDEAPHPHRRPLRWQPERRAGSVASRPAHCLSPVRASTRYREHDRVAR